MDSWDRFIETSLPPKEAFYNKLLGQALSDEEYAHAQKVWSMFGCKTILDYHDIYMKCMSHLHLHLSLTTLHLSSHTSHPPHTIYLSPPFMIKYWPCRTIHNLNIFHLKVMYWSWPMHSKSSEQSA